MNLEDLIPGASVRGILPDAAVTVVNLQWHGSDALTLVYRDPAGKVADEILYRHDEARLDIVEQGRPWSFDGDGAGKTIMAGLLIKELIARGDLERCLVVCPGTRACLDRLRSA